VSTRADAETWLPARSSVRADVRLGLVKNIRMEETTTFTKYRKFGVDSRIVESGQ
jgi:hypothetical protein